MAPELGFLGEIGQSSFYDHRVRDEEEFPSFRQYVHMNPVQRGLVPSPEEFLTGLRWLKLDVAEAAA